MRKFLISYHTETNDGSYGFGHSVAKLNEDEMLTPEVLDHISDGIKEANDLKSIVVIAFSEFDKEETYVPAPNKEKHTFSWDGR